MKEARAVPVWFVAAALALAAVAPYMPALRCAFLMDTHAVLIGTWDEMMRGPERAFTTNACGGFRPLTMLSVFWTSWWFENNELAHRLGNYVLHAASALVVFAVGLRMGLRRWGAAAAALLFAWSPCFGLQVPWIAARPDLFAGLAAGLVFLAYCRHQERATGGRLAVLWLAVLLLALSKEVGALVPLAIVAMGRGHRRRYAPLLLVTVALVLLRLYFQSHFTSAEFQADYDPLKPFRDPERMMAIVAGSGRLLFAMLSGTVGSWHVADSAWVWPVAIAGFVLFGAVLISSWRPYPAAPFAAMLALPAAPMLFKDYGYYLYAAAVLLVPSLVVLVHRLPKVAARSVLLLMLAGSMATTVHVTGVWGRASVRFRDTVATVEPYRREAEQLLIDEGRPVAFELLGLPYREGPLFLFPPNLTLYAFNSAFFNYYRSTDPNDYHYLQRFYVQLFAGEIPAKMREFGIRSNWVIRTVRLD